MWSGHSCPLPLQLVLFLVSDSTPQGERNREGHDFQWMLKNSQTRRLTVEERPFRACPELAEGAA